MDEPQIDTGSKKAMPRTRSDLARDMIGMRLKGHSFRVIGAEFGVSHETARQMVQQFGGPDTGAVRRLQAARSQVEWAELECRIRAHLRVVPASTCQDVADSLGLSPQVVTEALGADVRTLLAPTPRNRDRASDEELLEQLQVAADLVEGVLTGKKYDEVAVVLDLHSRVRMVQRFGSWARACELAGVDSGRRRRSNYRRKWSRDELVGWVATYLSTPGVRGTYAGYDEFARATEGAPSSQTIRNYLGTWAVVKGEALVRLAAGGGGAAAA